MTIENPTMIAENMFGIPLHDVQTRLKGTNERPIVGDVVTEVTDEFPHDDGLSRAEDHGNLKRDLERLEAKFELVDATTRELLEEEGTGSDRKKHVRSPVRNSNDD